MKIHERIKPHFGVVLLFCLCFGAASHAQKPTASDQLVLSNVTVVDVRTGALHAEQTVVLEGNRIASVEPSKSAKHPRNAPIVNSRGLFLIPGLWDMHVHLVFGDWFPDARDISLPLFIANGVTGVRDMGGDWETLRAWRREIASGALVGPRIVASGPYIEGGDVPIAHLVARTPDEGRTAVDSLVALGVDFIKVHTQLKPETYYAVARRGLSHLFVVTSGAMLRAAP